MRKRKAKLNYRRIVLRLPDLDHSKMAVLNSLTSPGSRRVYQFAINQFITWYCSEPRLAFNRIVVVRYRMYLESRRLAANTINQQLAAVRRLAHEAADAGLLSPDLAAGISRVKGVKQLGQRSGNWLSLEQSSEVLSRARGELMREKRDYAMLALLFGCGLRRSELVGLEMSDVQQRQEHWAIVDLIGKGGHIRTVPIPEWAKRALDEWTMAAGIRDGRIFRRVSRTGKVWGKAISQNVVWYVVKGCCEKAGLERIAPHDLRRTCAKLCHSSGGEIEQIQFLLGHASVQTTERYLGCKQNLGHPVNDRFNLVTAAGASADQQQAESMQAMAAGDTIRRGECHHAQPANALSSRHLFEDARPALVTDSGRRTFYVGRPRSQWQLRVYDKTELLTRFEFIFRLEFLRKIGIRYPHELILLRRVNLSRLVSLREVDRSKLPKGSAEDFRARAAVRAMSGSLTTRQFWAATKDYGIKRNDWFRPCPIEKRLQRMQDRLVW
jgi:site-specific recombinase XerD